MAAFNIAARLLVQGGTFVAKIFRGRDIGLLFQEFQRYFGQVYCAKPKSCRNSSIEAFLVAKGFKGVPLQSSNLSNQDLIGQFNHLLNFDKIYYGQEEEETFVPFVACGADSELDADMNYSLMQQTATTSNQQQQYTYVEPRQAPIKPPYEEYFKRKNN